MSGLMQGKRAFVTGVANDRSIAWAIAEQFHAQGAVQAFSYPGEAMGKRTIPLVKTLNPAAIVDLDVSSDAQIDSAVAEVAKVWDSVDVLVHSIGFAPREALDGRFVDVTTREAWRITLDVSAYSLIALARAFRPLMKPGSAIVTLTYLGSERVVTNYNVMGVAKAALEASTRYLAEDLGRDGIRVNAISAGPLKTLAAAGIKGMRTMLAENAAKTPLRRNIDHEEVGKAALFLCSSMGSGITGEVMYVDAGQNIMGPVQMGG
ncbi:MAG TPA: enoyl-ACP reductase [Anaeromyxobacteraceae bacterium]|nr:enoyl-ACP reductase [Anaeromyxobacteraceae bacterium]